QVKTRQSRFDKSDSRGSGGPVPPRWWFSARGWRSLSPPVKVRPVLNCRLENVVVDKSPFHALTEGDGARHYIESISCARSSQKSAHESQLSCLWEIGHFGSGTATLREFHIRA